MSVNLVNYSKIKDKVLLGYFGHSVELLEQLLDMRPLIERELTGITFYIGCLDEYKTLVHHKENVLTESDLKERKREFGKVHMILCDGVHHGVGQLMENSNIPHVLNSSEPSCRSKRCLIAPKGNYPTVTMSQSQINAAISVARKEGYSIEFGDSLDGIGWVIGVENVQTWVGCRNNIRVSLVPNGVGTNFYITSWNKLSVMQI